MYIDAPICTDFVSRCIERREWETDSLMSSQQFNVVPTKVVAFLA